MLRALGFLICKMGVMSPPRVEEEGVGIQWRQNKERRRAGVPEKECRQVTGSLRL